MQVCTEIVAKMLALEACDPKADIKLYINSQGRLRCDACCSASNRNRTLRGKGAAACARVTRAPLFGYRLFVVHSSGGTGYAIVGILDAMRSCKCDIR